MAERVAQYYVSALPLRILKPPLRIAVSQLWHERTDHDAGMEWLRGLMTTLSG